MVTAIIKEAHPHLESMRKMRTALQLSIDNAKVLRLLEHVRVYAKSLHSHCKLQVPESLF